MVTGFGLVAVGVTTTAILQAGTAPVHPFDAVYPLVYFGLAGGLGGFVRQRALRLTAVEGRATALEGALEREAELAAARGAGPDRARTARRRRPRSSASWWCRPRRPRSCSRAHPRTAASRCAAVQETGRQSLAEMRRLLGVLRAAASRRRRPRRSPR